MIWQPDPDLEPSTNVARFSEFLRASRCAPRGGLRRTLAVVGRRTGAVLVAVGGIRRGEARRRGRACAHRRTHAAHALVPRTHPQLRAPSSRRTRGHRAHRASPKTEAARRSPSPNFAHEVGALAASSQVGRCRGRRPGGRHPSERERSGRRPARHSLGRCDLVGVLRPSSAPARSSSRFRQLEPKVVIAAPGYRLGGKDRRSRHRAGRGASHRLPSVESVVWVTGHTDARTDSGRCRPSVDWANGDRHRRPRSSSRTSSSATRSGCCSPRGRRGCRRASCTATEALCSSS